MNSVLLEQRFISPNPSAVLLQDAHTWAEREQGAKVDAARLQVKALERSELTGLWQSNWEAAHQLKTKVGGALEARKLDGVVFYGVDHHRDDEFLWQHKCSRAEKQGYVPIPSLLPSSPTTN